LSNTVTFEHTPEAFDKRGPGTQKKKKEKSAPGVDGKELKGRTHGGRTGGGGRAWKKHARKTTVLAPIALTLALSRRERGPDSNPRPFGRGDRGMACQPVTVGEPRWRGWLCGVAGGGLEVFCEKAMPSISTSSSGRQTSATA